MEQLFEQTERLVRHTKLNFKRFLGTEINWNHRLIAIQGARGVGKTTLMLQQIKEKYKIGSEAVYASLDNLYFAEHSLLETAKKFSLYGGKIMFLDEVHKYPAWSVELKNIHDSYPELKIVFSASSVLDIYRGYADLSRRVVSYSLPGLSFREFLELHSGIRTQTYSIDDIIRNHTEIAADLLEQFKPLPHFKDYLSYGYYPFYNDVKEKYYETLARIVNTVLEIDIPQAMQTDLASITKMRKLLAIIAAAVPFKPNITKLAERTGISRNSILTFINYLEKAQLISNLTTDQYLLSSLAKPDKIFLDNSNLLYALSGTTPTIGTVRETFFNNQTRVRNQVRYSHITDFLINDALSFEIGGKNKNNKQIQTIENSFVAADEIEIGFGTKIPLYMFGLGY